MAALGSLVIELAANTARLQSDMGKAVGIAQRTAGQLSLAFKGIAGGFLGASLINTAKQAIDLGDNLNKAAIKAGVTGETISELAYAAKQSDIDLNSLSNSLRFMQTNLSKAASGGKEAQATLAALGLTLTDIQGLATDKQFELIGDRISQLREPADRARAAVELFGRSGADLLPLFEQGAKGIRTAREEAQRIGAVLSNETIAALAEADDKVKRLSQSWDAFAATLTAKVAPALADTLDALQGDAKAQASFLAGLGAASGSAEGFLTTFGDQGRGRGPSTRGGRRGPVAPGFKKAAEEEAKEVKTISDGLTEYVVKSTFKQTSAIEQFYADLEESTRTSIQSQVAEYARLEAEVSELVRAGRITEEDGAKRVQEALDKVLTGVEVTAKRAQVPLESMSEFALQAARNMQSAMADFFFDPFADGLKGMLKGFVDILRRMVAEAAAAKIFEALGFGAGGFSGGGGGLGGLFSGITKLFGFANGGQFKVGGSGGTDSQLVAFRASPNETVTVTRPDQRMGGPSIVLNYSPQIDARGADIGLTQRLPAILNEQSRRIFDELDRRYGLRPT